MIISDKKTKVKNVQLNYHNEKESILYDFDDSSCLYNL